MESGIDLPRQIDGEFRQTGMKGQASSQNRQDGSIVTMMDKKQDMKLIESHDRTTPRSRYDTIQQNERSFLVRKLTEAVRHFPIPTLWFPCRNNCRWE